MSVTGGFFNSLNGDRKYNAEQLSSIFNGIITEGVFEHYGDCFKIRAEGLKIIVGTGRAWLNSTWLLNDSELRLTLPNPDAVYPRYDAVILDMDSDIGVRANSIKVISGTKSGSPSKPSLVKDEKHKQYPLCYVYRTPGQTSISNANIELMIGKTDLPYITAPLKAISVQDHYNKWEAEFTAWFESVKGLMNADSVTAIYNEIAAIKSVNNTQNTDISNLKSTTNSHTTDISNLKTTTSSHTSSITNLNKTTASHTTSISNINNALADTGVGVFAFRKVKASTSDLTAGSSSLTTGNIYIVYE